MAPPIDMYEPSEDLICYDPAPVRAMCELINGIKLVRGRLEEIGVPALVAHAVQDRFVPLSCADELEARLHGPVHKLVVDGSGHALTADVRKQEVAEATRTFLRRYAGAPMLHAAAS